MKSMWAARGRLAGPAWHGLAWSGQEHGKEMSGRYTADKDKEIQS